ncbi:hypothetical protein [Nitrosovibrio sp. Nv6]|uniref:hypothetical protein n=1 Tax=Nitrosovibrio sp. Nv6 TaxID=1855340 RepID=UPI0008CD4D35|nr:hypothetical protein [Nitrosovibrio sp. Nv6]SEO64437.1 hypothetical protein SAMN05216316_0695 [Nitrosovibrio sp. Nv6]
MATWPETLPPPTLSGYGGSPVQAFARTDMESGPARQRQRFTYTPEELTVSWKFTAAEMAIFRAFWQDTIHRGTDWFVMTLDTGDGMIAYDTRFTKPYKYEARPGMNWIVSGEIEVRGA